MIESDNRVPVCGRRGLTVSRAIWDEAWLGYCKKYPGSGTDRQHERLLREGFYESELDSFRPGWRPVEQQIAGLEARIAKLREVVTWAYDRSCCKYDPRFRDALAADDEAAK